MNPYIIKIGSIDLDINKINEKIYELKQIINKVNDLNQFLEKTKMITLDNLEDLKDFENLYDLINNHNLNKYIEKLEDTNYNDNKITQIYISIFTFLCSDIGSKIESYENKINNIPDILQKSLCKDNLLNELYFKKNNIQLCIQILELYFSLEEYFNNEFYFSKNLDNIYSEIYTIGLEILNLRKIKENDLKSIFDDYINYRNILDSLNYYQKKKLIYL
tara:strand:+ start:166 stop:822 length:657 start_codon:yes stop_codon:yes gene_type:complete